MPWSSSVEQCGDLWGGGCEEDQTGVKRSSATHIFASYIWGSQNAVTIWLKYMSYTLVLKPPTG